MFAEEGNGFPLNITICYTLVFLRTFMYVDHITIMPMGIRWLWKLENAYRMTFISGK